MSRGPFEVFRTIRGRIALLFTAIFGLMLIGFSTVLYELFSRQGRDEFDDGLIILAASIAESIQEEGLSDDVVRLAISETPDVLNGGARRYAEVLGVNGEIKARSRVLPGAGLRIHPEALRNALNGTRLSETIIPPGSDTLWGRWGFRLLLYPVTGSGGIRHVVAVASPLSTLEASLLRLRLILYSVIPVVILICAAAGWYLARRAFDPVDRIVRSAESITADRLHERLPVHEVDDELGRLSLALNRMIERLEASFRAQKQFTSDSSHELNTPLTILKGEMQLALEGTRSPRAYRAVLKSSIEEIRRLQSIVDSLLLLSRAESGRLPANREAVRLDELLMSAVQKVGTLARRKKISITLNIDETRQGETNEVLIPGDPAMLLNVVLNILNNALTYSPPGSAVRCAVTASDGFARLSITDNGPGIPPEHVGHVFDRFYRVDSSRARRSEGGTGLGLSIAKAVVQMHGGTIEVTSREGTGTTVVVTLPVALTRA